MDYYLILAAGESGIASEPVGADGTSSTIVPDKQADPNGTAVAKKKPFGGMQIVFLALMLVMMYMILFRGPRKKQQQHKQMVRELSKNDKVRTIGGIIGTVVDIKGDEVILKIDESNNTKMRVSASAIGRNMSKEGGPQ
ncbi:MAG: preprotein translocase subunit YajC [Sedimentisphaerales bacterium]|nr:preprotein translocase subunit YajC [Sedimentisphaerales bacterium]